MSFLPAVFGLAGVVAELLGPKKNGDIAPPIPDRSQAEQEAMRSDILAKRRGIVATMLNGATGVEASGVNSPIGKSSLGA